MSPFFILQNTDGVMAGVCLLLFIFFIFIKMAPKVSLSIIVACLALYICSLRKEKKTINTAPLSIVSNTEMPLDSISKEKEDLAVGKSQENKFDGESIVKEKGDTPELSEDKKEKAIPKEYEAITPVIHTYQTGGFWKWDDGFIKKLENRIGWRKARKGNFEIKIGYTGIFSQVDSQKERKFIYSGGDIEIKIDGRLCHCRSIAPLPKGISANNFSETSDLIQQEMTRLILKDEVKVIRALKKCLLD